MSIVRLTPRLRAHTVAGESTLPPTPVQVVRPTSPTTVREAVFDALGGAPRDLVVDLREVRVMSNIEVGVLVAARARQRAQGASLTLVLDQGSAAAEALSRTGLSASFRTAVAVDSAPSRGGATS